MPSGAPSQGREGALSAAATAAVADAGAVPRRLRWSNGLLAASRSWPLAADPTSAAWLGDVPHLQAFREPGACLDVRPRHVLQQDRPTTRRARLSRAARGGGVALLVQGALIAGLVYLLSFRDAETPHLVETPVEVVLEAPKPPDSGPQGAAGPKASETDRMDRALAPPPAPDPHPPAPAQLQPPTAAPAPAPMPPPAAAPHPPSDQPSSTGATPAQAAPAAESKSEAPKLLAPPPEPVRAAADEHQTEPANAAPADDRENAALREAKPAEIPQVLATADRNASFAVPLPASPKSKPSDKPAPPIPAKEPSATQKLAAVLPMGALAMPASFRAALSGDGSQVSTAYKGLVFGRFNRHPEIGERARRQHLRGQVIIAFSIGDDGAITEIAVGQTSGDPALDAIGIELIRAAAPFPPPPPDAQRSFTPALAFGE